MNRNIRPGVDRAIAPAAGVTRQGQPLSYSRAPAPDLAPWIGRFYVTVVDAPANYALQCGLLADTACIRVQLRGAWTAQTRDGPCALGRAALVFGPNSKRMAVGVTGSFTSVGAVVRPGAGYALTRLPEADLADRFTTIDRLGLDPARWLDMFDPAATPEAWCQAMEQELRAMINWRGAPEPDPVTARFEAAALANPSIGVAEFAAQCGIEQRRLERIVRRDFGLTPKQVLRRARALDMASHLRGVADDAEAETLALRYYDQSHLIREFTAMFGMSPRQFVDLAQPLMTLSLETRQARRLETTERIAPGGIRPWQ
ncbi:MULTISPECIES: helix-turn-helix domain-containing protein [unclassified Novosphingobium]|uniref:helix-turn-helix domain-containing protein n=1 Tax=Novosphingobium TaxID=165696 RepID=UPI001447C44C|nr:MULTISPECIES: AraC family transcriptional regulator [unclassified Novosphingobium]NKJ42771.1 AraC-like DNA-binding protein [Novosphingobium sp. SG720]NMN05593.1 AraC-like DNA-binding protein [Novosphingobium sp. SG919]NMN88048.1 AraC-like DNA-binding protein [Novosphingobium sp. SG916]